MSFLKPNQFDYTVPKHGDERGVFVEMLKTPNAGQFSYFTAHPGKMRLILVKISSGLGNMYDTAIFPDQPGGILGAQQMRLRNNDPVIFSPLQVLDGAIHTLI